MRAQQRLDEAAEVAEHVVVARVDARDVAAGAERAPLAAQHERAHAPARPSARRRRTRRSARRAPPVERVELLGRVQHDLGDAVGHVSSIIGAPPPRSTASSCDRTTPRHARRIDAVVGAVAASDVVVDDDAVGRRVRLAGEHVAALELVGLERVVLGHRDAALDEPRPARAAHAARARERHVGAHPQRRVEDRLVRATPGSRRSTTARRA